MVTEHQRRLERKGAGLGVVLKSARGARTAQAVRRNFDATNNESEYETLIFGLELAKALSIKRLKVRVNSLLVIN